jgi:ANTAR domain
VRRLTGAAALAISEVANIRIDCAATLSRAEAVSITTGNTNNAADLAASEDRHGDGPITQAVGSAGPVLVDNGSTSGRWQIYKTRLVAAGYGAALAVPLRLDPGVFCTLVFLGPIGFTFTRELVGEAIWFTGVASDSLKLALEVRGVRSSGDNLKTVLESRTSIDVACGVIMAQQYCSYTEAFRKLADASRQQNLKVRSVAENIIKAIPSGPPKTVAEFMEQE